MKKNKIRIFFVVLLLLSTYIVAFFGIGSGKVLAATLQDSLNITNYTAEKLDGGGTSLETGERLAVHIEFEIKPLPEGTQIGDTFEITIPNDYNFEYLEKSGPLGNNDPSDPYLTYEIVGDRIIFTICEAAIEASELHDGVIDLRAIARNKGENIDGGGNGQGPILEVTPGPDPSVYPPQDRPFPDEDKYIHKEGKDVTGQNSIAWSARINYQDYGAVFDNYTKDQGATKITDKANGLVIDHLTPGTHFKENSLYVTVPTYIITTDVSGSRMGDRQIGENNEGVPQPINFSNFVIEKEGNGASFIKLEPAEGQTYQEFQDYVQAYPDLNNGQRAYGVYKHADKTETVLIAFGTLPGSVHYYDDLKVDYAGYPNADIHQAIDLDETISDEQKRQLHEIYGKKPESPTDGAITAYDFSFAVDVDVPEYGSGKYKNDLSFIYNDNDSENAHAESDFDAIWGDVEADFLKTYKKVSGDDERELAEGKVFEFKISDRYGTVVAYGKTKTVVTHKGREIEVIFYRDENYTIPIENNDKNDPNHWSKFLIDGRWYTIQEVNSDGYEVHIQDTKGNETNQFRYESKQEHRWRFIVVNKELIDLEAEKKISGIGSLAQDKEFHFELRDTRDGIPVAFGKTKITTTDGKNNSKPITFYTDAAYTKEITKWQKMEIDGNEVVILEDGVTYELVEIDSQGYEVIYHTKTPTDEDPVEGNMFTADYENGGKISFTVENKDKLDFEANKRVEGSGLLTPNKTYEFELKDITSAGKPVVAYGKVTITQKGQNQAIEFFTTSDYAPANKITDWAKVLREDKTYQLIETQTQHYKPIYSGGSGTNNNEFKVTYNDSTKKITMNVENQDTFDFNATKKVTGDGVFDSETFKFELLNGSNQVIAHGRAEVNQKNTEVPITFYTDPDNPTTKINDWTDILTNGETYQLREVDDSGYAITYLNQDGTKTNEFTAQFNTGQTLAVHVENSREKVPLPETGGEGYKQQLVIASMLIALVVITAGIIEYRRKAGA